MPPSPDAAAGSRLRLPWEARLLLIGVGFDALGSGLALPFLVVYLHDVRHLDLQTVGLVAATPSVVALMLLGPMGVAIDRFGPRRVQVASLASQSVGVLLLSHVHAAPSAFLANGLVGFGHAAFWPANQSLISVIVPDSRRPRYFGLSFTLLNAGIGIGGLVAAAFVHIDHPGTFQAVYSGDAVSFVVPMLILLVPLRHVGNRVAAHHDDEPGTYREVLRDRPFRSVLTLTLVSSFVGYGMLEAGWTAFARTVVHASTRTIGIAFAANTAAIVGCQLVVLRYIDGRRRTRAMALLAVVWAVAWAVMGLSGLFPGRTGAAVLLVVSLGIFGLGETLLSPTAPALTNALATDRLRGRYNAVASIAFQVGAIVAPASAGFLLGAHEASTFVAMVLVGCAVMVVVALRLERALPAAANRTSTAPALTDAPGEVASPRL